ncbi:MAG: insulinase family protein [Phycisphaeraceae bacterium]|nr:insulinase family protein [Phycisphaerales bacterium]MCB9861566.1 insulinase family protein [Phycisphaeraceae bacterium]
MPSTIERTTLDNGLTIVAEPNPNAHSSSAGFFVRTGTRDETLDVMGVSHYLEHMLFKGTSDISAEQLNRAFDEIGARNNAYTSHELTCYYAHVIPEHITRAVDLLGRMMRPALRTDDFNTEKGVILEEIAMYDDNPFSVLYEETAERHYRDDPLGYRVLGTKQSITDLSCEQMRSFFSSRYVPNTMTLALAGKIDFESIVSQIEQLTRDWPKGAVTRENTPSTTGVGEFVMRRDDVARGYMLGLSDAPAIDDPARHAFSIASHILGGGDNSRLHWALIETGLAEEAAAGVEFRDGSGVFMIYASGNPDQIDTIKQKTLETIDQLAASITDEELERVKTKIATQVMIGTERPADLMRRLGKLMTLTGECERLEEELEAFLAVSLNDVVKAVAASPLQPATLGMLMPAEQQPVD